MKAFLTSFLALMCCGSLGLAQSETSASPTLEALELSGTSRLTASDVASELGLVTGTPVTEALMIKAREQLLSLGLFRSVSFYQQRGSERGKVKLLIVADDDEDILSDWGLGGLVGITHEERELSSRSPDAAPLGYRLELIARNLFKSLHRGLIYADIDSRGIFREGKLIYGMPRFTREDVQFDVRVTAVDVKSRYLNAVGFGGRIDALWTKSMGGFDVQYGPAMYVSRSPRFAVGEFPKSLAGPKLSLLKETRLMGFFPSQGYAYSGSLMYAVTESYHSMGEFSGAYTLDVFKYVYATLAAQVLAIGTDGYSLRAENRYDIPIGPANEAAAQATNIFVRLRTGSDKFAGTNTNTNLFGSSATLGLRYHSPGFIAEFAVEFTKSPRAYVDKEFTNADGGDKP